MTTTTKPRRRWFQFRLRTLLVLMLLVSIGMGWLAVKMQQARKQREAVSVLLEGHGDVEEWRQRFPLLSPGSPNPYAVYVRVPPSYSNDSQVHAWLRTLFGDDFLAYPVVVDVSDDVGMEHLNALVHLEGLNCCDREVSDAGLEHVEGLTQLQSVRLNYARVTDAGVKKHLKGLIRLHTLSLAHTQVTDACLEHLKGMPHLIKLDLTDTPVTDARLEHLAASQIVCP